VKGEKAIDVTALMTYLEIMIGIADRLAETTPYLPSIKKLRDNADREVKRARRILDR
jgi:hypothetical protein